MNWTQSPTSKNVLINGDWRIVRFKWTTHTSYILWFEDEVKGRFNSADEAKNEAAIHIGS